ncbi:MAG: MATE family efflux transporter [Spirochaetia bacterium]|nr:MATE family efflux transporter [Spirochaetia bacterium]
MKTADLESIQFEKMTKKPVPWLILSLCAPTIVSMLTTSIYHTADAFFVSQLGTSASGAVGIVFSLMAIIQAVGFSLGMGCGSLIARALGARDEEKASMYASSAFFAAMIFGITLTVLGLLNIDRLMRLLGSTPTILPYARDYARFILLGAPIMCSSFVMNNVLRSEGKAAFSMIGLTVGGFLNVALDPLLILYMGLGTAGAALATLISQCVSFSILLQFFIRKKSITKLQPGFISHDFRSYVQIVKNGFPSLCRQGLASISTVMLNVSAAAFGDAAVAAMSIVTRLIMFVASIMIGIGQGFTPVSGYNYGAKLYARVRQAYWFTVRLGFVVLLIFSSALVIWAPAVIRAFRDDPDVISIGTVALRWQACVLPLHALIVGTNMLMQSTGQALKATFLACNRQGVYFIPLIMILPKFLGLHGVEITQACSDFLSVLTAIPYALLFIRSLKRREK